LARPARNKVARLGLTKDSRTDGVEFAADSRYAYAANLLDILPEGIIIIDSDYQVVFVNSTLEGYFGINRSEMIGQDKRKLINEKISSIFENGEEFRRRVLATYENNSYIEHFTCHVLPGPARAERWLEHRSQPIRDGPFCGGRAELYFDVTERVLQEKELDWLSGQLLNLQERERERRARDLHDGLGQAVVAQKLMLEALVESLGREDRLHDVQARLIEVIREVERISEEIRRISFDLMPSMLESLGLRDTLEWMSERFSGLGGMQVDLKLYGLEHKRLPPQIEVVLFRVFQEALNNILKHARATRVSLKLSYVHPKVVAVISDDGRGFDPQDNGIEGLGLKCMKRRVTELGGSVVVRSRPGQGTTVRVEIPCECGNTRDEQGKWRQR